MILNLEGLQATLIEHANNAQKLHLCSKSKTQPNENQDKGEGACGKAMML
jgi:hypothetical protein